MFCEAKAFNQPLDTWDVSNVENMSRFSSGSLYQPPENWEKQDGYVNKEVVVSKEMDQMVRRLLKAVNDRYKNFGKKFSETQEITIFNEMAKSFDEEADKSQFNAQLIAIKKMSKNELNQTLGFFGAKEEEMVDHSGGGCCTIV